MRCRTGSRAGAARRVPPAPSSRSSTASRRPCGGRSRPDRQESRRHATFSRHLAHARPSPPRLNRPAGGAFFAAGPAPHVRPIMIEVAACYLDFKSHFLKIDPQSTAARSSFFFHPQMGPSDRFVASQIQDAPPMRQTLSSPAIQSARLDALLVFAAKCNRECQGRRSAATARFDGTAGSLDHSIDLGSGRVVMAWRARHPDGINPGGVPDFLPTTVKRHALAISGGAGLRRALRNTETRLPDYFLSRWRRGRRFRGRPCPARRGARSGRAALSPRASASGPR